MNAGDRWARVGEVKRAWREDYLRSLTPEMAQADLLDALDRADALIEASREAGLPPLPEAVRPLPISPARLAARARR